jgi:hypothetical protein
MKKGFFMTTLTLAFVLIFGSCALAEGVLQFGYSFNDRLTVDWNGTKITTDVKPGFDFSFELTTDGNNGFVSGFGVDYQLAKTLKDGDLKFQYIPVYGVFGLEVSETETNNVYLLAKLGYNFFRVFDLADSASARMGYYYAAGFGMKIGPYLRTQALYEVSNGSVSDSGVSTDCTNALYTFKCGYAF